MTEYCKRDGCNRQPRGDDFCSRYCYEVGTGQREPRPMTRREKDEARRLRENGPDYISVETTDAMSRRAPGSYGSGKNR